MFTLLGVAALPLGTSALGDRGRVGFLPPHVALTMPGLRLHGAGALLSGTSQGRGESRETLCEAALRNSTPNRQGAATGSVRRVRFGSTLKPTGPTWLGQARRPAQRKDEPVPV